MQRPCAISKTRFEIDQRDLAFYEKIGVPAPTLCPAERMRRRLAWRSRMFYLRACSNCAKRCISWFPPQAPVQLLCEHCYQSDSFDALKYGRDFDFSRPFFPQMAELLSAVPRHASNATMNENCEYIISAHQNRDCYMTDECDYSRECYYGYTLQRCTNIVEGLYVLDSEIGYQLVLAEKCYNVHYSQNVFHCSDSAFLMNCRSCKHCLFCSNLRNQEYHIRNRPVSREEFEQRWRETFCGQPEAIAKAQAQFAQLIAEQPAAAEIIVNCEDCSGNYLVNCKNVTDCYNVDNSRDCRYCTDIHNSRDCYDVNIYEGELLYETNHAGPEGYRNFFCHINWFSSDIAYCVDSRYIKNCLGCVSLKKEEFCILNRRYREQDYRDLSKRIIAHMRETGEWGEYFPITMSPLPYNVTLAQLFLPLVKEKALAIGLKWLDDEPALSSQAPLAPDTATQALEQPEATVYRCQLSGKGFKFTRPELVFYQRHGIPTPKIHPTLRVEELWKCLNRKPH